jgi:hypothetical protein
LNKSWAKFAANVLMRSTPILQATEIFNSIRRP